MERKVQGKNKNHIMALVQPASKTRLKMWIIVIVGIILLGGILLLLRGDEDTWIKDKTGAWVKHGNPSAPMRSS